MYHFGTLEFLNNISNEGPLSDDSAELDSRLSLSAVIVDITFEA